MRDTRTHPRAVRAQRIAVPALALLLVLGAGAASAGPAGAARLPPPRERDLAKLFRAQLAPLGLKVSRGMLQNLDTYEADPKGTHLAL